MNAWLKAGGYIIAAGMLIYFCVYAAEAFADAPLAALLRPTVIAAGLGSVLLYATIVPVAGWAWSRLLSASPNGWRVFELTAIVGVVQLAKYVPGNVAQHIGRAALARSRGMELGVTFGTILAETLLAASAGLLVGVVALGLAPSTADFPRDIAPPAWLAASAALAVLIVLPAATRLLLTRLERSKWASSHQVAIPANRSFIEAFAAYTVNYLAIGAGFWLLAWSLNLGGIGYWQLTATFALGWIAGFITPGLPAGMGVREGAMALLLSGSAPAEQALVLIVGMRIVTMSGDLLWFGAGSMMLSLRSTLRSTS